MGIVIGAGVVDLPKAATYLVDIWLFSDITNALMAIPNLIGLLLLSKIVVGLVKDYFKPWVGTKIKPRQNLKNPLSDDE